MAEPSNSLKQTVPVLIGVAGSIAVALIGVFPQLRKQDRETIEAQGRTLEEIKAHFGLERSASEANGHWTIRGRVQHAGVAEGPGEYEVYLVPGNSHLARPGDDGRFSFDNVLPGSFFLVVRELGSKSNGTARALIMPDDRAGRLESHGACVEYQVSRGAGRVAGAPGPAPAEARVALQALPAGTGDGGMQ